MSNNVRKFPRPFINFKIELMNNCAKKRKLDHSSPESSCETPAKQFFSPNAVSPDLGCFMDFCSPPARPDSLSPLAISQSDLFDRPRSQSETKETTSTLLKSQHAECGSPTGRGSDEGTVPGTRKYEKVQVNLRPPFDLNVEDILCLSPFGTSAADHAGSGKNPSSSTCQNEPVSYPVVEPGPESDRGDGEKDEYFYTVKDEEDKGYFSMSYLKHCKLLNPQLPPTTSSPMLRLGEVKAAEDEGHSGSSSDSGCSTRTVLHGPPFSLQESDPCPGVSGPPPGAGNAPVEPLEGDVEEPWNIGLPIFESSVCHNAPVKLDVGSERSLQESEEVQGGSIETPPGCQTTLGGAEDTLDTSYETTLPLQVKVKSVIVALGQLVSSSKPAVSPPEQNVNPARGFQAGSARSRRPVVFESEAEWERQKNLYVACVTRHMNENAGGAQDVMTELLKLMADMADRMPGIPGKQWQHPSDLTCRNYGRHRNSGPQVSLSEWQAKNCPTLKRFATVPKIFERSPFP